MASSSHGTALMCNPWTWTLRLKISVYACWSSATAYSASMDMDSATADICLRLLVVRTCWFSATRQVMCSNSLGREDIFCWFMESEQLPVSQTPDPNLNEHVRRAYGNRECVIMMENALWSGCPQAHARRMLGKHV